MGIRRGELHARVGLGLRTHQRAHEAGAEAMAVYTFCLLQARAEERDGAFGTAVVVNGCWGLPAPKVRRALDRLVEVGLVDRGEGGELRVASYEEWNETTADIASRRSAVNARVTAHRERVKRVTNAFAPVSVSVSVSGSDLLDRKREPERQAGVELPAVAVEDFLTPPAERLAEALAEGQAKRDAARAALAIPADLPVTAELEGACVMAGVPKPTPDDVRACLAHARQEHRVYPDWTARLVVWMGHQKRFRGNERASPRRLVQPTTERPVWEHGEDFDLSGGKTA